MPDNPLKLRQPRPDAKIEKRYRSSSSWPWPRTFQNLCRCRPVFDKKQTFLSLFQLLVAASIPEHAQRPTGIASIRDDSTGTRSRFPPTFFLFSSFFFSPIEGASKLSRLICRRRAVDSMKIRAISTVFVPINVLNFVDRETVIEESSGNSPPLDRFFQSVLSDGRTQSDHAWRLLLNTCARAGAVEWNNPRTGQTRRLKPVSAGYRFNGL